MQNIEKLLFGFFGIGKLVSGYDGYYGYECEDFHVDLLERNGTWLVSVDLHSSFNKTSQSPIHFIWEEGTELSKRKTKRIFSALNFLLRSEKDAGGFFGSMPGFDDMGEHIRGIFYSDYY